MQITSFGELNDLFQIIAIVVSGVIALLWLYLGSHTPSLKVAVETARTPSGDGSDVLRVDVVVENPSSYALSFDSAAVFFVPRSESPNGQSWQFDNAECESLVGTERLDLGMEAYEVLLPNRKLNIAKGDTTQLATCRTVPSSGAILVDVRIGASRLKRSGRRSGKMQWSACAVSVSEKGSSSE